MLVLRTIESQTDTGIIIIHFL